MTTTRAAANERWLEPAAFGELQRDLIAHVSTRYRTRFGRADSEELANHAAVIVWQRLQESEPIEDIDAYALRVVDNLARRAMTRDLHTRRAGPELDTPEGQHLVDRALTAGDDEASLFGHVLARSRTHQGLALLHGLRRIRPRDVEIFAGQIVQGLSPDEVCQRIGVSERQRRKAVCRVTRWIACATQLIEDAGLSEHEILSLAYHRVNATTSDQQAVAERILARPDGPQLLAQVSKALRNGAYLPLPLSATEPQTPLRRFAQLPDTLAAAKQQLTEALTATKQTIATATAQYGPLAPAARPGAAIGAALAVCVGSTAVCVDQGILPNPLAQRPAKKAPQDRVVNARGKLPAPPQPRPRPAATQATTAPAPVQQTARLRAAKPPAAPSQSAGSPSARPAGNSTGTGTGGDFGGGSGGEFGGGSGGGAPAGGGSEFGGGGSGNGGGAPPSSAGGGGGEFGVP